MYNGYKSVEAEASTTASHFHATSRKSALTVHCTVVTAWLHRVYPTSFTEHRSVHASSKVVTPLINIFYFYMQPTTPDEPRPKHSTPPLRSGRRHHSRCPRGSQTCQPNRVPLPETPPPPPPNTVGTADFVFPCLVRLIVGHGSGISTPSGLCPNFPHP
jgi:hypothetical protein